MIAPVKCLVASALAVSAVNGHGYMTKPAATFSAEAGDKTQFIATIDSSTSGLKGSFATSPADNVASFTKAFASSKYKSIKALIDDKAKVTVTGATLTCGNADPDAAAQPLPKTVEWSHSDSEGFTASHEGPCEVWCDDVRAFQDENCSVNYKSAPAELPYESSKCQGASKLTFYWMAMHGPSWQVYVNCANLSGGSGATQQTGSTSTTTTDSSSANTPATPSSGGSPSTTTGSSSDTPTVTSAPASGGSPSTPAAQTPSTPSTTNAPSSTGNSSPSTSTTSVPSTTTADDSECGSYDIAGDDTQDTGSQANTYQQSQTNTNQGPSTGTESQANTNQWSNTGTGGTNTNQWSGSNGGNTNQWSGSNGGNTNQWTNTGTTQTTNGDYSQNQNTGTTQANGDFSQNQNTGTGSQTSFNFNNVNGPSNTGTVSPQSM